MANFSILTIVEGLSFVLSLFDKTKINVPGFFKIPESWLVDVV